MNGFEYQCLLARDAGHEQYLREADERNKKFLLENPLKYDYEEIRSLQASLRVTVAELRVQNLETRLTDIENTLETLNREFSEGIKRLYSL